MGAGFRTYLPIDAELCHRIHDTQKSWDGLGLLSNLCLVNLELQSVVLEVSLNLLAVNVVDVQIRDSQYTSPPLVAFSQLRILGIEDAIEEGKVI